jgi:RecA/RadA recombinase
MDFLNMLLSAGEKQFGKRGLYVASQQEKYTYGLEHYSIALQYLLDSNIVPLQNMMSLAGPAKTYKTSALLEFSKLFVTPPVDGMCMFINTEGKMSSTKIPSLLGDYSDKVILSPANSIQQWQEKATFVLNQIKDAQEKIEACKSSNGRSQKEYKDVKIPPTIICIDSLTGAQSDMMIEQVVKEGSAPGKTFQDRAALITQWLNTWGSQITGLPVFILLSNHLKDAIGMSGPGGPGKMTPGGAAAGFHVSYEIYVSRIKDIDKANCEGAMLQWRLNKSSLGQDKRRVTIPYYETYNDAGQQIAWFDWDEALCLLLMELQEESRYKELREVCGIQEIAKTGYGKVYTCNALGIDRKKALEENCTASVVGGGLQKDPALRTKLRDIMHIKMHKVWTPDFEVPE